MAQVGNENRFGGQYMVQDRNHMSEISNESQGARRGARQTEQSQSGGRQQGGGDQFANSHEEAERQRNSR